MLLRQLLNGRAQLTRDDGASRFVGRYRRIVARRADDQPHFARSWNSFPFGPGAESAVKIARQNRNIAPSHERTDSRLEVLDLAGLRSRALGKNDEDVAGVREELTTDPRAGHAFEKIISGGRGKGAVQSPQGQTGEQTNGVEMARMIRDKDEGAIIAEMLFPDDLEAAIDAEQSPNDERDERTQSIHEHVGLTGKIPETLGEGLIEVGRGFVLPPFHRSLE
jgi:hypothetical protein